MTATATRCQYHYDHYLCGHCCPHPHGRRNKVQGILDLRGPYTPEEIQERLARYAQAHPETTIQAESGTVPAQLVSDMTRVIEAVREATTKEEMSPEWLASAIADRIVGDCELTDLEVNALCKALRVLGNQLLYKKTAERRQMLGIR